METLCMFVSICLCVREREWFFFSFVGYFFDFRQCNKFISWENISHHELTYYFAEWKLRHSRFHCKHKWTNETNICEQASEQSHWICMIILCLCESMWADSLWCDLFMHTFLFAFVFWWKFVMAHAAKHMRYIEK